MAKKKLITDWRKVPTDVYGKAMNAANAAITGKSRGGKTEKKGKKK